MAGAGRPIAAAAMARQESPPDRRWLATAVDGVARRSDEDTQRTITPPRLGWLGPDQRRRSGWGHWPFRLRNGADQTP